MRLHVWLNAHLPMHSCAEASWLDALRATQECAKSLQGKLPLSQLP
jgi:hypothetical protein